MADRKKEKRINPETGQNEIRYTGDDLWQVVKDKDV